MELLERMERICNKQERLAVVFENFCCQLKQITAALGAPIPSQQPLVSGAALPNTQPLPRGNQSKSAPPSPPQGQDRAPEQAGYQ